jgi:hypothetical protein
MAMVKSNGSLSAGHMIMEAQMATTGGKKGAFRQFNLK